MSENEKKDIQPLGKALQEARVDAAMTVEEVAIQLNLAVCTIRDIEEQLAAMVESQIIPRIYLRGYVANYAKLVNLQKLDQFPEYHALLPIKSKPINLHPPLRIAPVRKRRKGLLFIFILLAIIVGAVFVAQQFFFNRESTASSQQNSASQVSENIPVVGGKALVVKKKEQEE